LVVGCVPDPRINLDTDDSDRDPGTYEKKLQPQVL
jgi:hypothetical protein